LKNVLILALLTVIPLGLLDPVSTGTSPGLALQSPEEEIVFVGIKKGAFEDNYRAQEMSMWCWATSIEMVLDHSDIAVEAGQIVRLVKGAGFNAPGNPFEMVQATNQFVQTTSGKTAVLSGQFVGGHPIPNVMYNHLKRGKPFVLTYQQGWSMGHAVVVHGMDIRIVRGRRGMEIHPVTYYVADPLPQRQVMTPHSPFPQVQFDESLKFRQCGFRGAMGSSGARSDAFPGVITGAIFTEATLFN